MFLETEECRIRQQRTGGVWPETRTGVWVWDGLPPAAPVPLPDGGREGKGPEGDHQDHHPAGERGQGREGGG